MRVKNNYFPLLECQNGATALSVKLENRSKFESKIAVKCKYMANARNTIEEKICSKCKNKLHKTAFYKDCSSYDGLQSWCKKCVTKRTFKGVDPRICVHPDCKKSFYSLVPEREYCSMSCALKAPSPKITAELMYLTGLIISDGSLNDDSRSNARNINFSNNEDNLIETVQVLSGKRGKISTRNYKDKNITSSKKVSFTNHGFFNFLNSIGVFPNKSLTIGGLNISRDRHGNIPYFWLLLRGLLESDGSVTKNIKNKTSGIKIHSGSKEFLEWLKKELENQGIEINKVSIRRGSGVWSLYISADYSKKLYAKIYNEYKARKVIDIKGQEQNINFPSWVILLRKNFYLCLELLNKSKTRLLLIGVGL